MIQTSDSLKSLAPALFAFQGAVKGVERDRKNDHFRSRYATLEAVIDAARPALQAHGIVFTQSPGAVVEGALEVTTLLIHAESGEWMRGVQQMPLGKRDPQGAGSALTYAMRYALMAMLGLPPVDDDGEGAMDRGAPARGQKVENPKTGRMVDPNSANQVRDKYAEMEREVRACSTREQLNELWEKWEPITANWPAGHIEHRDEEFNGKARDLREQADAAKQKSNGKAYADASGGR